jgi:hypothetical protein
MTSSGTALTLRLGNESRNRTGDREVEATMAFAVLSESQAASVTHAMIRLWTTSCRPACTT